jgi:hypothetical protein
LFVSGSWWLNDWLIDQLILGAGMKDSKEFANALFDAYMRRKGKHSNTSTQNLMSKHDLYEYWLQITNKEFDSRIQTFFDL